MQRSKVLATAALTAAALFAGACGDDGHGESPTPVPTATLAPDETATAVPTATADPSFTPMMPSESSLRVIHGSPDASNVDILLDGEIVRTNVPYLASSDYLSLPAGTHNVQIRAAGTDTIALDFDLTIDPDTSYTAIATDFLEDLNPFALVDDRATPGDGLTKIRIGHAAPSAPNVDVYVTAPGGDLVDPVLMDVPFQFFSEYLTVASGDYQVRVTPAGSSDVVIDTGTLALESNVVLTAIAFDAAGGGEPFSVELYLDSAF